MTSAILQSEILQAVNNQAVELNHKPSSNMASLLSVLQNGADQVTVYRHGNNPIFPPIKMPGFSPIG